MNHVLKKIKNKKEIVPPPAWTRIIERKKLLLSGVSSPRPHKENLTETTERFPGVEMTTIEKLSGMECARGWIRMFP